jgi:hypothetical protein
MASMSADDVRRGQHPGRGRQVRPEMPRPAKPDSSATHANPSLTANSPGGPAFMVGSVAVGVGTQVHPTMPAEPVTVRPVGSATSARPAPPPMARTADEATDLVGTGMSAGATGPIDTAVRPDSTIADALSTEPVAVAVAVRQPPSDEPPRPWHPNRVTPPIRAGIAIVGVVAVCASFIMALRSPHPVPAPATPAVASFHAADNRLGIFWHPATSSSDH